MKESTLQSTIRKAVLARYPGSFIFKVHGGPMQMAGIPDLVGCIHGRFVGLEVKLPVGSHPVSPVQRKVLDDLRRAGGIGAVVRGVDEALELLESEFDE